MQISGNSIIAALSQGRGSAPQTNIKSADDRLAERLAAIEPGGNAQGIEPEKLASAPISASNETAQTLFYAQQAGSEAQTTEFSFMDAVNNFFKSVENTMMGLSKRGD